MQCRVVVRLQSVPGNAEQEAGDALEGIPVHYRVHTHIHTHTNAQTHTDL